MTRRYNYLYETDVKKIEHILTRSGDYISQYTDNKYTPADLYMDNNEHRNDLSVIWIIPEYLARLPNLGIPIIGKDKRTRYVVFFVSVVAREGMFSVWNFWHRFFLEVEEKCIKIEPVAFQDYCEAITEDFKYYGLKVKGFLLFPKETVEGPVLNKDLEGFRLVLRGSGLDFKWSPRKIFRKLESNGLLR